MESGVTKVAKGVNGGARAVSFESKNLDQVWRNIDSHLTGSRSSASSLTME
jgi:hypothetical protein